MNTKPHNGHKASHRSKATAVCEVNSVGFGERTDHASEEDSAESCKVNHASSNLTCTEAPHCYACFYMLQLGRMLALCLILLYFFQPMELLLSLARWMDANYV